ncbi:MAG TPA: zf-HC2 domain-containing protein [Bryobacterales bacterium]|nr:zf-HC2 domain-containing protein [Bryobacterales bacterium]
MSCSPFDLRDFWLEELGAADRRQVEKHLEACARCREELERLRMTQRALLALKDEEVPRRIAFISDKVFEPSGMSRWWAAFLLRVPRFALSASLLLAVLFGGLWVSKPSITLERERWQIAFGGRDSQSERAVAAMQARYEADMRDVKENYELLVKELNVLYMQSAQARPAAFRQ